MRITKWMSLGLSSLVLMLAVVACESNSGPTNPGSAPHYSSAVVGQPTTKVRGAVPERSAPTTVVKRIGSEGGKLELGGHELVVPAYAVNAPVVFRMRLGVDGYVEVDLTATGTGDHSRVDVGERGFARPVTLRFSYATAEGVADATRLKIVWVKEDGTLEVLDSKVDSLERTVTAELEHFSKYAMAFE